MFTSPVSTKWNASKGRMAQIALITSSRTHPKWNALSGIILECIPCLGATVAPSGRHLKLTSCRGAARRVAIVNLYSRFYISGEKERA